MLKLRKFEETNPVLNFIQSTFCKRYTIIREANTKDPVACTNLHFKAALLLDPNTNPPLPSVGSWETLSLPGTGLQRCRAAVARGSVLCVPGCSVRHSFAWGVTFSTLRSWLPYPCPRYFAVGGVHNILCPPVSVCLDLVPTGPWISDMFVGVPVSKWSVDVGSFKATKLPEQLWRTMNR